MLSITESDPNEPPRVLIYGPEGVGKSTLGAKSDKPIFISPEAGTGKLKTADGGRVKIFKGVSTWDNVLEAVKQLRETDHGFKTLVIDSADWLEGLAHQKIIGTSKKDIVRANGGYGAGYRESQNMHQHLIRELAALREAKGMNVIVTAHAHVKAVKDPSAAEDYDSFEIKCHEFVSSLWREWVDALLFARFTTYLNTKENVKARAVSDGSRVIYTQKQPAFQAKNRYGLPAEVPFTEHFWVDFMSYAREGVVEETIDQVRADIEQIISKHPDEAMKAKVMQTMIDGGHDIEFLKQVRARAQAITGGNK